MVHLAEVVLDLLPIRVYFAPTDPLPFTFPLMS